MTFPYNRSAELTLKNPHFVKDLERFLLAPFQSDIEGGDLTMEAIADYDQEVIAKVVAKSDGRFCGAPLLNWFVGAVCPSCKITFRVDEGALFQNKADLMHIKGKASEILKVERTLLNALQRFCGIATQTAEYVKAARGCPVAATRKTLYGLLDKYAVSVGGGLTHRLNLGDAPLFKENHFELLGRSIANLILTIIDLPKDLPFVTIEIDSLKDLHAILKALPKDLPWPVILLLDNFSTTELLHLLPSIKKPDYLLFEASGGITLENINEYAQVGVDVISVGALTHSVPGIDLSLQV